MNPIFKKLNFKENKKIFVLSAPPSFKAVLQEMKDLTVVKSSLTGATEVSFFLAFVTRQNEVDEWTRKVIPLLESDGLFWFAYPKGSSRKYKCEFNRDTGWQQLGEHGFEPVRQVAIDEDWTAMRFRRAENIRTMTRSFAMSETGKRKVSEARKKSAGKRG